MDPRFSLFSSDMLHQVVCIPSAKHYAVLSESSVWRRLMALYECSDSRMHLTLLGDLQFRCQEHRSALGSREK